MKRALIGLLLVSVILVGQATAKIGLGLETLTILPYALTLNYWDPGSGWGVKASTDFGLSPISLTAKVAGSVILRLFGLNQNFTDVHFTTLALTKDFIQGEDFRSFAKLGVFTLSGSAGNVSQSSSILIAGIGGEWQHIFWHGVTGSLEIGYPDLLTLGLRYYF